MAGAKLTPRQKMINMMYLVLTALLALNVSKEIINAFVTMSKSLEVTNTSTDLRNQLAFKAFEKQMQSDAVKTKPHYDRALKAESLSKAMVVHIEKLKERIVRETEKLEPNQPTPKLEDIRKQDDFDTPTRIMCGTKTQTGKGFEAEKLKKMIIAYENDMLNNLDPKDREFFKARFDQMFNVSDPSKDRAKKDNKKTWEMFTFYHNPVVKTT